MMQESASFIQNLYCLTLYLFVSLKGYNHNVLLTKRNVKQQKHSKILLLLAVLFATTYFSNSDYFHYKSVLIELEQNKAGSSAIESIYKYIAFFVDYCYPLFRLIIWGSALWLCYKSSKVLKINSNHFLYTLFIIYISLFSYSRATLGMSMVFLGIAFFFTSYRIESRKMLGICLIFLSYFLHHSLIILIAIFIVSINFKLNKRNIWILSAATFLGGIFVIKIISIILTNYLGGDEYIGRKMMFYTTNASFDESSANIIGKIRMALEYICFIYPTMKSSVAILRNKLYNDKCLRTECIYNNMSILLILLAIILLFLPLGVNVLSYRVLYMSMIGTCFCLTSFADKGYIQFGAYKRCLILGFIYTITGLFSNLKHSL